MPLVRKATAADGPAVLALIRALAHFESLDPPTAEAEGRILRDAFADPPRFELWVAEESAELVAYAVCFTTYSTFRGQPTLFLEDLFVHPKARCKGVATAMMKHLRGEAEAHGCGRFEWMVLNWNQNAIALYEKLGAEVLPDWRLCRIDLP